MTDANRVFITGLSALTSCGHTARETWSAVKAGVSGISTITQYNLSNWSNTLGGEIKHFNPADMLLDRKLIKVISRQDILGINAAMQAVNDSQLLCYREQLACCQSFNDNTAVYVGSPGNKYFQQYDFLPLLAKTQDNMQLFAEQLFSEVHPMWLLRILPNNVLAYTGINCGFKGPNHNITNHAVGGAQAILEAYHAIKQGQAERAVVVAYDIGIEPQALFYYDKLGLLSPDHLKPFDKKHNGTILAEGAAALVLESEASVRVRNARCYGELHGGFCATEAQGLFSIDNQGKPLTHLLQQTLNALELEPAMINMLVAHGNGNKKSDDSEAQAIDNIFKQTAVPITAFKWAVGHTLCASAVIDTVLTLLALQEQLIPGIASLDEPAFNCQSLNISNAHRKLTSKQASALIINRGFASMNACVVVSACG